MTTTHRMAGVDGLRGIAALAVVVYHYEGVAFGTPRHDRLFKLGELGVELFFIISGFVILLSLEKGPSIRQFAVNRFMRLYPAYWFSMIPAAAALFVSGQFRLSVFLVNATMCQSFINVRDLIEPYWTLGYELWFYIAIGLIVFLGHLKNVSRIALCWLAICVLIRGINQWSSAEFYFSNWNWIVKAFRPDYVQFFIAGIAICQIVKKRDVAVSWATLAAATLYTAFGHVGGTPPALYFCISASFVTVVLLAAIGRLPWLELPIFFMLGSWSYSIYLLHLPIARLLAMGAESVGLARIVGVILAVPVCFAMAAASARWIERPAVQWGRKFRRAQPSVVTP